MTSRGRGRAPAGTLDGRREVLRAARAVFAERGYAGATTREILTRSGTTSPTLHHHFGSKAGLYLTVLHEVTEEILQALEDAVAGHARFLDRVDALLDATVAVNNEEPALSQLVFSAPVEVRRNPELADGRARIGSLSRFLLELCRTAEGLALAPEVASRGLMTILYGLGRSATTLDRAQYEQVVASMRAVVHGGFAEPV